jgi:hypothetical protein
MVSALSLNLFTGHIYFSFFCFLMQAFFTYKKASGIQTKCLCRYMLPLHEADNQLSGFLPDILRAFLSELRVPRSDIQHLCLIAQYHACGLCPPVQFNMKWMPFVRVRDRTDKR